MTSPRSAQSQAIKCGGLELETVNSPLGLRGVGGSEEDQGGGGWLQEVEVMGFIKLSMTVHQTSPKRSRAKQHTFIIVSRIDLTLECAFVLFFLEMV